MNHTFRLRHLEPGAYFILKRTGVRYQFLGVNANSHHRLTLITQFP